MKITPHTNLLKSLRGERVDYVLLIGEGVDNALDAGATVIGVFIDDDLVTFDDNGSGVTKDRIGSIFSLGDHGPMSTTALGRFGIGIKSQAVNAGDVFALSSISRDGKVSTKVNWRAVLKSNEWEIEDPRWSPIEVGSATGTRITISELRNRPRISVQKIIDDAAERFYPAIASGRRLSINRAVVPLLAEPPMTDIVDRQIALSGQRSAHLRAGILCAPSTLIKVHVAYRHRVLMPASSVGCGTYGGLTKMFARVQLDGPWHFAKYKNDLTDDEEREELEEAVGEALQPILEKCNTASMSARLTQLGALVNDLVPQNLAAARPKTQKERDAAEKEKRKREAGSVRPEKSTDGGPARTKRHPDRLLITFDGIASSDGIGAFQPGRTHRVNLSKDDPTIAELIQYRDQNFAAKALVLIALAVFEAGRRELSEQRSLFSFGHAVSSMMKFQRDDDEAATA